ncbi:sensor histidine kinase [Massilia aquatica]|uniref:histidine kinase n=1 Tax=Massilia aquatica TaxID=2609000 RepID=A0ABX0MMB9_9BURK|nr:HAMP domain-containing sensor histidine kinase [Massilia aquatica]NHZ44704.1 HAMP domain-containing histidine kinase [Massilia aquatica]
MRLSKFISDNIEVILQEWEDFAGTLHALDSATKAQLRDHAKAILAVICVDLDTYQSVQQGIDKAQGNAPEAAGETAAEAHAVDRLQAGFKVEEVMAEYRALRASVLRLWQCRVKQADASDLQDMLRFNEAIDQSLTESLAHFSAMVRDSQNVFLAILGHHVRNPLGAISMGTQLILQDGTLAPRHLKVAAQVLRSTQRVSDIVSDLLDYSTSHLGGGIPVTPAPYDLSAESRSVVQEMKLFHPEREFRVDVEDDIGVCWDRARMSQALSNLLANAVQHGAAASPVWVTVSRQGGDVLLVVQNEGEVISPRRLRTMFDPAKSFAMKSTSERSASQSGNLGLGLYITHEIVLAHGGKIWVSSTELEGTTIKVRIATAGKAAG